MMGKILQIYQTAVPVSAKRHHDWCIRQEAEYGFARDVMAVPLTLAEFRAASGEYAIVFASAEDAVLPVGITGLRQGENLYVSKSESWGAKYIPAFIRRYPFVFSVNDEGQRFTLCIDEEFAGFNQTGHGERLFDADGNRTLYLKKMLDFLQQYQVQFERTKAFSNKLRDLGLLDSMRAEVRAGDGQRYKLNGCQMVNTTKLKELPDEQLAQMVKSDELELIYLHLLSARNLTSLGERIEAASPDSLSTDAEEPAPVAQAAAAEQEQSDGVASSGDRAAQSKVGSSKTGTIPKNPSSIKKGE